MSLNQSMTNNLSPTVELDNVIHVYRSGSLDVPALQGLSCNFYAGEICVLMGPSGCGKTTLLNLISGLLTPNSGKIHIQLKDTHLALEEMKISQLEQFRRKSIAYIFQTRNLIPYLTCYENAIFPFLIALNDKDGGSTSKMEPDLILEQLGMKNRMDHYPSELSGGEQQRTCFAAALIKDADIILCDEPTGELDSETKLQIFEILQMISKTYPTKTIIIVSHDHDFKAIADRVYSIRDGRIVNEVSKEDLLPFRKKFEDSKQKGIILGDSVSGSYEDPAISELEELKYLISKKINKKRESNKN